MQEIVEIRTPEAVKAFDNLAAIIRASYPEEVQKILFKRIIIEHFGASVSDPLNTPLTIWKVDIEALRFILASKKTKLSKTKPLTAKELEQVSHGTPLPLYDEVLKLYLNTPSTWDRLVGACSQIWTTLQTATNVTDFIPDELKPSLPIN